MSLFLNINFWSTISGLIGAILIFFFGLPPSFNPDGKIRLILEQEDAKTKEKGGIYKKISYIGISLLVLSFLLQFLKILFQD